jgi:hypothetical protein
MCFVGARTAITDIACCCHPAGNDASGAAGPKLRKQPGALFGLPFGNPGRRLPISGSGARHPAGTHTAEVSFATVICGADLSVR